MALLKDLTQILEKKKEKKDDAPAVDTELSVASSDDADFPDDNGVDMPEGDEIESDEFPGDDDSMSDELPPEPKYKKDDSKEEAPKDKEKVAEELSEIDFAIQQLAKRSKAIKAKLDHFD